MQTNAINTANNPTVKSAAGPVRNSAEDAKLKAACKDMEAVFLNLILAEMRKTVPQGALLGQSAQQDILQSMLDSELTKGMARAGGIGIADMLYYQLSMPTATAGLIHKGQAPK